MSRSRDIHKICRWDADASSMTSENLENLNNIMQAHYYSKRPYLCKPITFSKHASRHHKNHNLMPQIENYEEFKQPQHGGINFILPRRKHFYYEREYSISVRILAHVLYWLHEIGIFPSGTGLPMKRPPWKISPPLQKPENRDYIIEPDWDSI